MSSSIGRMHLTSKFCSLKVSVSTEFSAGEAPWKNLTGCSTATWWPTMGQCQARSWTSHHLVPSAHVLGWEVLGHGWAWLFPGPRKWTQNCNGDMLEMCLFWIYLFLSFVLCPVRQFGHGRRNRMSCQDAFQLQPPSLGVAVPRHTSEVLHFCCPKAFQKWLVGTPVLNILFHMLYKMVYWYNVDTHRLLWCLHKLAHETWTFAFFVARFGRAFLLTEEVG